MKNIISIFFLLFMNQAFCQDEKHENYQKTEVEVFGKCFKNLPRIEGTKDLLPEKKDTPFCSLYQCVSRLVYAEGNIDFQKAILKRAVEITTLLYKQGTPIYLTSGMGSFGEAEEKNQDLTDDNNVVYISITECITYDFLEKIKDIVNEQTMKLINKNNQ